MRICRPSLLSRLPRHWAVVARLAALILALSASPQALAADLTVAAASDLRHALDAVVLSFQAAHPGHHVDVVYGASGKLATQIRHGAPFDLFMSADVGFPRALAADGLTASPVHLYGVGRLVLWSRDPTLSRKSLAELPSHPGLRKFAIANPRHAPYGQRAEEALRYAGVWEALKPHLVFGDNVSQTAQFVDTGAADAGLVALSLVLAAPAAGRGHWTLVPAEWHTALEQGHVILKRAADNPAASAFARHLDSTDVRAIMQRHGFTPPPQR